MPVAVVSDTTAYLPPEVLEREGIRAVSLYLNSNGGTRRESDLLADLDGFYEALRSGRESPTTSQPSVGDFLGVYEPLTEAGNDVVSIHLAGGISGTVAAASQAADELNDSPLAGAARVAVVDSQSACGGLGLILLAAARAARQGATRQEVAAYAERARDDAAMWFSIDTLEYLQRGGRIGRVQAWVGGALQVKPILTVDAEGIRPVERVRTSGRAFERMTAFAQELRDAGRTAYCVQHIQSPQAAAQLAEHAKEIVGCPPRFVSEIGPVIGAHTGPGLLGIGGVPAALLAD